MYSIERDHTKNRIVVIIAEYDYEPSQLIADMQEAIADVKSSGGEFDILSDWSDASVMPQDHAQDSEGMSAWLINNGLRRSANVMTSVVQRMQVQRVSERSEKFKVFETRGEAERWLAE